MDERTDGRENGWTGGGMRGRWRKGGRMDGREEGAAIKRGTADGARRTDKREGGENQQPTTFLLSRAGLEIRPNESYISQAELIIAKAMRFTIFISYHYTFFL